MGTPKLIFLFITLLIQLNWSFQQSTTSPSKNKGILDQLFQNYDNELQPSGVNGTDGPITVKVNMRLESVTSVSDYDMDFGVQIYLRQEWVDERLKYEDKGNLKYLSLADPTKIWRPDTFITNEKDGHLHKLLVPNHFVRIYPSGLVLYSARLSLTLWCHMKLARFPFDTQRCSLSLSTYGSTTSDLRLLWKEKAPVQVPSYINIMGFSLDKVTTSASPCNTYTGEYTCLEAKLHFKRDLKYYILHTFLPSTVLVLVSWASFWMDRRAVVARILLVLSTLFAMSSLATDVEASVPHVPDVKAIDLWAGVCFTFLLAALVEFAAVNSFCLDEGAMALGEKPPATTSTDSTLTPVKPYAPTNDSSFYQVLLNRLPRGQNRIDSVARVLFPLTFFFFLVLYFLAYLREL